MEDGLCVQTHNATIFNVVRKNSLLNPEKNCGVEETRSHSAAHIHVVNLHNPANFQLLLSTGHSKIVDGDFVDGHLEQKISYNFQT